MSPRTGAAPVVTPDVGAGHGGVQLLCYETKEGRGSPRRRWETLLLEHSWPFKKEVPRPITGLLPSALSCLRPDVERVET